MARKLVVFMEISRLSVMPVSGGIFTAWRVRRFAGKKCYSEAYFKGVLVSEFQDALAQIYRVAALDLRLPILSEVVREIPGNSAVGISSLIDYVGLSGVA